MRFQVIAIFFLTLAGFALRLHYATTTHPFFDEYTTVLAARQILHYGWPILPSGLFYEHGLLATYLIAPFVAMFIQTPLAQWQPAQWGLMLARWPSVLLGTATIPLIYAVGCRLLPSPTRGAASAALLAAGLFALSPEGMVWGGRARMYALATLLVLLTVYWAYRGAVFPALARYRWWALGALLALLLTQFGAMLLSPPLIVAMIGLGWCSFKNRPLPTDRRPQQDGFMTGGVHEVREYSYPLLDQTQPQSVWFLRPAILGQLLALIIIVGLAIWVKRLGQPLGAPALGDPSSEALPLELVGTVTYQTAFHLTWADAIDFLAKQFGPPHLFWLNLAALAGGGIGLTQWLLGLRQAKSAFLPRPTFSLFLWLTFGLIILQMITLLDPFRRNPRYLVMFLPLFYLLAAEATLRMAGYLFQLILPPRPIVWPAPAMALVCLVIFTGLGWNDLRIALITPEPAYEQAFAFIRARWQPGDSLLTMNTPAAGLYLGRADGFTVQAGQGADQFLLNRESAPVDRWLGAPWLGTLADFDAALNQSPRTWFVIDAIRLPVYFRGDWLALVNSQMEQVWAKDNALVFQTRPNRAPLPTQANTLVEVTLGETIRLTGYTVQPGNGQPLSPPAQNGAYQLKLPIPELRITLFWQAVASPPLDYTVFLHLRNQAGANVTQRDGLSLGGAYPSSRWQPEETIIDPFTLALPPDLPAGRYSLWAGMYRLDTLERLPLEGDTSGENAILLGNFDFQ